MVADFNLAHLLVLALATYRLAHLLIEDFILEGFREWVWKRFPPETTKIGYLLTCYWCLGLWLSGIMVVLYLLVPLPALIVAAILAISAVVGLVEDKLKN